MSMDDDKEELLKCLWEKIELGKIAVEKLKEAEKIEGVDKLVRKFLQEIRFLEKVRCAGTVKKEHLQSTNLIHLNAIVNCLFTASEPIHVLKPFNYKNSRLEIDIVCKNGSQWIKVIARNARALTLISQGNGEYGQKSIIDQANCFLKCAINHPHMYRKPEIVFHFASGIELPLAEKLENKGIIVEGKKIPSRTEDFSASDDSMEDFYSPNSELQNNIDPKINFLNLDVSTLLAYVTNMTNGKANFIYKEPLLTTQAEWERKCSIKPILEELFENKELVVCKTAYENFCNIIHVIGGPNEVIRADDLMKKVKIVDDIPRGRIIEKLNVGGKIKHRSRVIFATGENLKSITVTANEGFVRAARMQGIECMVFIHEPRSLSEIKEKNATVI
ncbi:UPF0415 protein C7orf25 homolog [Leptopilina boulardi]|uniref:UPF0415 protein C7orf25 homolog n=1 Tax=Leptopilina boulardi TaxID=63433 RepID=UPI0021F633A6|nr:UPF0415 protein C7orf25 homolog [Leptopilina boulardi]